MPRPDKVAAVREVETDLSSAAATLLTDYRGLTVTELGQLRAQLREVGASYRVVKNTLARRAAADAGIEGLDDYLLGPTALVFCSEDPVGPAKALKAFAKDHPALLVKAGYLEGEVLDEAAALRLADLESREDLLAKLAGLMNNALAGFARLLQAPLLEQARLVQALIDAGGAEAKGFAPEAAAAPAAEEPAAEEPAAEEPAAEEPAAEEAEAEAPAVVEAATDAVESVAEAAADAVESAAEAAADVVESAAETVSDAAETVAAAATEAAEADAEADAEANAEEGASEDATGDED